MTLKAQIQTAIQDGKYAENTRTRQYEKEIFVVCGIPGFAKFMKVRDFLFANFFFFFLAIREWRSVSMNPEGTYRLLLPFESLARRFVDVVDVSRWSGVDVAHRLAAVAHPDMADTRQAGRQAVEVLERAVTRIGDEETARRSANLTTDTV